MPEPYNPWASPVFPNTGSAYGVGSPAEAAERQPTFVDHLLSHIAGALGRGFMAPGQALQSTTPITSEQMIAPAQDMGTMMSMGSGAVPAQANELRMGIKAYHGSNNNFEQFNLNHAGTATDAGHLGRAHYLSTDQKVASSYPHKYEVDAELASPLNISMPDFKTDKRDLVRDALGLPASATAQDITTAAKARGHDGVILDYGPTGYQHKEIAVFDDNLLKILNKL